MSDLEIGSNDSSTEDRGDGGASESVERAKVSLGEALRQKFSDGKEGEEKEKPAKRADKGGDGEGKQTREGDRAHSEESKDKQSDSDSDSDSDGSPILPPADMSEEEKKEFKALSPKMQQFISRRAYETRNSYTQNSMRLAEEYKPYREALESKEAKEFQRDNPNVKISDLVKRSIQWDRALRLNPEAAAKNFLSHYGIDADGIAADGEDSDSSGFEDRNGSGASRYSEEDIDRIVRERVAEALSSKDQEVTTQRNQSAVNKFVESKPLFRDPGTAEQLEAEMAPIVEIYRRNEPDAPPADLLEKAYDYVIKNSPKFSEVRTRLEAKAQAERSKQAAEKARKASRSISGGPGSGSPKRKAKSIGDALRMHYAGE